MPLSDESLVRDSSNLRVTDTTLSIENSLKLGKPFFAPMHRSLGYDLLEPIRRDFDSVLMKCDNNLDRALAEGAARQDYTFAEHARDLAGAARWNAAPLLRRFARTGRRRAVR